MISNLSVIRSKFKLAGWWWDLSKSFTSSFFPIHSKQKNRKFLLLQLNVYL